MSIGPSKAVPLSPKATVVVSPTGNEKTQNSVFAKFDSTRTVKQSGVRPDAVTGVSPGTTMVTVAFSRP